MKTIIAPTDFSDSAHNSLVYACELSKVLETKIVLFNAYTVPVLATDVPAMPVTELGIKIEVAKELRKTRDRIKTDFPKLNLSVEEYLGTISDKINTVVSKYNASYVVMGTKGNSGLGEFLVGTNAAAVMEKAICPVIVVPGNASFKGLRKIVLAADYGGHNFEHAEEAVKFAKLFNAELTLMHVSKDKSDNSLEATELMLFKNRVAEASKYDNIRYALVNDLDVFHGINSFIEEDKSDLLIISMRNRTLLQKIFSRSLTKRMSYHSHIPVMALHINRNNN